MCRSNVKESSSSDSDEVTSYANRWRTNKKIVFDSNSDEKNSKSDRKTINLSDSDEDKYESSFIDESSGSDEYENYLGSLADRVRKTVTNDRVRKTLTNDRARKSSSSSQDSSFHRKETVKPLPKFTTPKVMPKITKVHPNTVGHGSTVYPGKYI